MQWSKDEEYRTYRWKKLREAVLVSDRRECQRCRERGRYTRATEVHHVKTIRQHPELAFETHYTDRTGTHRQLISLCKQCHMEIHDEQHKARGLVNVERW